MAKVYIKPNDPMTGLREHLNNLIGSVNEIYTFLEKDPDFVDHCKMLKVKEKLRDMN
jgi:hypothetical protein